MIDYICPQCRKHYTLGDEWGGKDIQCEQCNQTIQIPAASIQDAPAAFAGADSSPQQITPGIAEMLRQTRPWVLFLAILGFIGCGLFVLVGLFAMLASAASSYSRHSEFALLGMLIYLLLAVLYFVPSYYLLKYGGGIRRFLDSGQAAEMENALSYQKSFWRFVGIMTIIVLSIYLIVFLAMMIFAFSSSRF
jgi:hypothetical protein